MKDPKLLLLAFLLVASFTGGSAFNFDSIANSVKEFGSGVKDWGQGFGEGVGDWGKGAWDKISNFKDAAMEKFMNGIPDPVKNWIGKGDYKNADVTELVDKIPTKAWNVMKLDQLTTMGKTKFDKLIAEGEGKIPPRILQELKNLQMSNVTTAEAITKLKVEKCRMGQGGIGCKLPKPVMMAYIGKLGDPSKLTDKNITVFGKEVVFNLPPPFLRRITDVPALKMINGFLKDCMGTKANQNAMCPNAQVTEAIMDDNNMKIYGKVDTWTPANITAMGGVQVLTAMDICKLKPDTLMSVKSQVTAGEFKNMEKRKILKALSKAENVDVMTAEQATIWTDSLGPLKAFVLPSDLPSSVMSDAKLKALVMKNAKVMANNRSLNPKTAKTLVKDMLKDLSSSNMTQAKVDEIGALLNDASPNLIQKLIKRGVLQGITLRTLGDGFRMNGPGSSARGQALLDEITKISTTNIPPNLVQFMSAKQMGKMNSAAVDKFMNETAANPPELDDAQKSALVAKVTTGSMMNIPTTFKSVIPSADFPTAATTLKALAKNMPPTAAVSMKASSQVFDGITNITEADIKTDLPQAFVMSAANAAKINLDDVPKVLATMSAAPPLMVYGFKVAPTMDACRAISKRMLMAAMKDRDVEDAVQFAQTMTAADIENTPPCVVAALGKEALDSISPTLKPILLQQMGMSDNSMSIPRSRRQSIISDGLKPLGDVKSIGLDVLFMLGDNDVDLPAEFLKKFDPKATEAFVTKLERLVKSPMKPCFDKSQREQVAQMIVSYYGDPNTWDTLEGRCCLLPFLSSTQWSMITADVISSCSCEIDDGGFEDFIAAKESLCKMEVGDDAVESFKENQENLEKKQTDAALITLSDLNARRRKRAADASACDKAAIAGASAVTTSEIDNMANDTILGCISNLGQEEFEDKAKAKAIFEKIKLAKDDKLDTLTVDEMTQMQYIWIALMESDIMNLPNLTYNVTDDAVLELGKYMDIEEKVCKGLAMKVLKDWKAAKDLSAMDLSYLNQLICCFNDTDINEIPNDAFKKAILTIKGLEDCPYATTQALVKKAMVAFGDTTIWDSATVNEMGKLIGGLSPEKLMRIKSEAISGLTVDAIESITPESIKAMKVDQIKNLPAATAMAISEEQKEEFNDEMMEALEAFKLDSESGVAGMVASVLPCLIAVGVILAAA